MTKYPNPLFPHKKDSVEAHNKYSMTASDIVASAPISPLSGEIMVKTYCRDTSVYCDLERRLVLPVKKGE